MLHHSGMVQIDIHLCLNIEKHISQEVVVTGMYSDKDIIETLNELVPARSMFLSSFVWFVEVS